MAGVVGKIDAPNPDGTPRSGQMALTAAMARANSTIVTAATFASHSRYRPGR